MRSFSRSSRSSGKSWREPLPFFASNGGLIRIAPERKEPEPDGPFLIRQSATAALVKAKRRRHTMQRHHHGYRRGPFPRRPGLPPFGRGGLLNELLVGGLGCLIGRQQGQRESQPRQPQDTTHREQVPQ